MKSRRFISITAVTAAAGLLAACGSSGGGSNGSSGGGGNAKITIGYTAVGAAYTDLYVCNDQGIFKKHGLDAKIELLNSSSQLFSALASGSVQIGAGVASSTAAGALGADTTVKYISLPIDSYYMEMWGKKEITSPDQIKGKKIGLSSPGSLGDAAVDAFLKDKGWSQSDVKKVFLKSSPAEVTALDHGSVDAIVTQPPNGTKARTKGFIKVMDFTKYKAAANAYTAMGPYAAKNAATLKKFVAADTECLNLAKDNKAVAMKSIKKWSGTDDEKLNEYAYNFFKPLWRAKPTVTPSLINDALKAGAEKAGKSVPKDTSTFIDNSAVAAASKG